MRPKGSAEVLARRRRRALALLDEGLSLNEVARRMDCQASSVMRWRDTRDRVGEKVFEVGASPGRPSRLTPAQKKRLLRLLLKGPMAHGYSTDLWTCDRIAKLIRREFGVRYHRDHIGRLMHQLGWSYQKPERRALERDEEKIDRWKRKNWPRVRKTLRGWVPTSSSSTSRASS
ncbi:MAG: winged helix-turn-helix domain-containing protein [Dehalococcoidia bacterium]